jgi:hypothetical protein
MSEEFEEVEVEHPAEPEVKPDVVLDPEDVHTEGGEDARQTGEQPPLDAEGPEPGQPAQEKSKEGTDGDEAAEA